MTDGNHDRGLAITAVLASASLVVAGALVDGIPAFVLLALGTLSAFGWALLVDLAPRRETRGRPVATLPRVVVPFVVMARPPSAGVTAPPLHLLQPPRSAVDQLADHA